MPNVYDISEQYRQKLLCREWGAVFETIHAYGEVWKHINQQLDESIRAYGEVWQRINQQLDKTIH